MPKRRILFVSCAVGMGHVSAANAVLKYLQINYPNIEGQHIELMDFLAPLAKKFYFESYSIMAKNIPKLWGAIYRATENPTGAKYFNQLTVLSKKIGSKKFFQFIQDYQPDFILCTHFTPADLIINHAHKYNITKKIGILLTDYTVHSLQFASPEEFFFVSTPAMRNNLIKLGARKDNITISGIPISPIFFENKSITELQKKYKINPQNKTILFLSGGEGFVRIDEAITTIFQTKQAYNIIAIAGKNKDLYNNLAQLTPPSNINFHLTGWTDKMDEYMRMADIVITKPGGMTISECIYLRKPMILIDPVPGQEEDNIKFLKKNHLGYELQSIAELPKQINKLLKLRYRFPASTINPGKIIIDNIIKNLSD